jgi:hypothetical protein
MMTLLAVLRFLIAAAVGIYLASLISNSVTAKVPINPVLIKTLTL